MRHILLALTLMTPFAVPVQAAEVVGSPEHTFILALNAKFSCELGATLEPARTADELIRMSAELSDCKEQAKDTASAAFKVVMDATTDAETKTAIRKVYAAWLTAIGELRVGRESHGSAAELAVDQARNELFIIVELR